MNKIIKTITALSAVAAMGLQSCGVDSNDRFVELDEIKAERTVLLMDFTGQRCVNCPEAHEIMEDLVNQYGEDNLITVSIHAGGLAISVDRTDYSRGNIGLMIKEGNDMNDAFGINQWPMGVVDRINAKGVALNSSEWAGAVREALQQPTDVRVEATAEIEGDNIEVDTKVISDKDQDCSLQLWVVEDNISAMQVTQSGTLQDYVHNNVLRAVCYPVESGKPLRLTKGIWFEDETDIVVKYTDKERWNRDNLSIVAFVFQGSRILNATKTKVINENNQ